MQMDPGLHFTVEKGNGDAGLYSHRGETGPFWAGRCFVDPDIYIRLGESFVQSQTWRWAPRITTCVCSSGDSDGLLELPQAIGAATHKYSCSVTPKSQSLPAHRNPQNGASPRAPSVASARLWLFLGRNPKSISQREQQRTPPGPCHFAVRTDSVHLSPVNARGVCGGPGDV